MPGTLRLLKLFIREEVDRCVRNSAGLYGGGIGRGNSKQAQQPLPGLGTPGMGEDEESEKDYVKKQEPPQFGARARKRGEV